MAGAIPLLLSCGRSDGERTRKADATPATTELAKPWVEERVRAAIAGRGTVTGTTWVSAYWVPDDGPDRYITVEDLQPAFEPVPAVGAPAAAGEWRGKVEFVGRRHRLADDAVGTGASDWVEGAGPVAAMVVYLRRKKNGAIVWATSAAGIPPVEDRHFSPDERDVLATALQSFQDPSVPAEQRASGRSILHVLREDARILREVGGGVDEPAAVNALYVERARAIDLGRCPPDFAEAYRIHLDAWRKGEKALIESTWVPVADIANRNGVGTFQ